MNPERHNLTAVLLTTMLFFTFSMVHEFDWLLPPSPVATTVTMSGIAEEIGCEDEIEHDNNVVVLIFSNDREIFLVLSPTSLFISRVLTPPPDMA